MQRKKKRSKKRKSTYNTKKLVGAGVVSAAFALVAGSFASKGRGA